MIAARIRTQAAKFSLSFMILTFDVLQWPFVLLAL